MCSARFTHSCGVLDTEGWFLSDGSLIVEISAMPHHAWSHRVTCPQFLFTTTTPDGFALFDRSQYTFADATPSSTKKTSTARGSCCTGRERGRGRAETLFCTLTYNMPIEVATVLTIEIIPVASNAIQLVYWNIEYCIAIPVPVP